MRLFVALDIDDPIRQRIARFTEGVRNFAPDARWAKEESLHVTLKFIGEQGESSVARIREALAATAGRSTQVVFRGYGFFPTTNSARVFWIGMEAGPELAALAAEVDAKLTPLGIAREQRKFTPHLTLARSSGGSGAPGRRKEDGPRRTFEHLQEKLSALPVPEFGSMTAHEFFLYQSRLSPKGSTYTKLARFDLA
ncbi:MAG TPA: RNA 2',3'-cyclic phosphodiesterase [Candidatus Sulfotelmatobacter sp.]